MPIYEYTCTKCKEVFSELQSIRATEKDTKCPKCGSNEVKRNLTGFCCTTGSGGSSAPFPGCAGGAGGG